MLAPAREHRRHLLDQEREELDGLVEPLAGQHFGTDGADPLLERAAPAREQWFAVDDRLVPDLVVQRVDVAARAGLALSCLTRPTCER